MVRGEERRIGGEGEKNSSDIGVRRKEGIS